MTAEQTEIEQATETKTETPSGIFQAIGVIVGDVAFIKDEERNKYIANITIGQYQYNLFPNGSSWSKSASFNGLRKQIESTGISKQKLIVYPKITHYPGREQQHKVAFQLVAFEKENVDDSISNELNDFEFKLSGLWQFIPVCRTPCITVMKNFSAERLEYIKQAELASKVNFMKASHIPLIWRDAPVNPLRFNPKIPKEEQGKAMFVSIKAKFIPGRDMFGFDSLLALPQEEPPKYLKAGKKDKAEVLKSKMARKREGTRKEPIKVTIKPKVIAKNQDQIGTSSAAVIEKPKLKPKA
ncbi:hypothetical protein H6G64_34100 [Calothrix sp. FACHB-156]|nr:hypothetical protein [Calothrix sp. FACHB-156]